MANMSMLKSTVSFFSSFIPAVCNAETTALDAPKYFCLNRCRRKQTRNHIKFYFPHNNAMMSLNECSVKCKLTCTWKDPWNTPKSLFVLLGTENIAFVGLITKQSKLNVLRVTALGFIQSVRWGTDPLHKASPCTAGLMYPQLQAQPQCWATAPHTLWLPTWRPEAQHSSRWLVCSWTFQQGAWCHQLAQSRHYQSPQTTPYTCHPQAQKALLLDTRSRRQHNVHTLHRQVLAKVAACLELSYSARPSWSAIQNPGWTAADRTAHQDRQHV